MRGDDQLSHWLVEVVRPGGASASSGKSGRGGARGGIRDGAGEAAGLAVAVEEAKNERSGRVLLILVHVVAGCDTRGPSSHGAESPRVAAGQAQEQAAVEAEAEAETEEALKWALLKPLQVAVQQHQFLAHAAVNRIAAVPAPLMRSHPFSLSPQHLPSPSVPPLIPFPSPPPPVPPSPLPPPVFRAPVALSSWVRRVSVATRQLRAVMHVEASLSRERGLADVAHRFHATRLYIGLVKRSVLWSRLSALSLAPHSAHHQSRPTLLSALPPACLLIEARGTRRLSTHSHPLSASATPPALPESLSLRQGGRSARSLRTAGSFLDGARRMVGRRSDAEEGGRGGEYGGKKRKAKSGVLEARGTVGWEGEEEGEGEGQVRARQGQSLGKAWSGAWSGAWQQGRGAASGTLEAQQGGMGAARGGSVTSSSRVAVVRSLSVGEGADDAHCAPHHGRTAALTHAHSHADGGNGGGAVAAAAAAGGGSRQRERGSTPQQQQQQHQHAHPSWLQERRGSGSFMPTWSFGRRTRGSGPLVAVERGEGERMGPENRPRSGVVRAVGVDGGESAGEWERECESEREGEGERDRKVEGRVGSGSGKGARRYSRRWRQGRLMTQSGPLGPHSPSLASPCAPASAPAPPALAAAPPHGSMAAAAAAQPGGPADAAAARAEEGACSGGGRERFHRSESITEGGEGEEGEATEGARGTEECVSVKGEAARQQVEERACGKAGNGLRREVQSRLLHADVHSAAPTPPPWPMGLFRSSSVPGPSSVTRASPSPLASSSPFSSSSSSARRPPTLLFARASSVPGSTRRVSSRRHARATGGHGGQGGRRRHSEGRSRRGAGSSGAGHGVVLAAGERGAGGADAGRREEEEAGMEGEGVSEGPDHAASAAFPHSLSSSSSSSSSARLLSLFRASCTLSATPTSPASPADTASPAMPPRSDGRGGRGGRAYEVVPVDWLQEVEARRARMSGASGGGCERDAGEGGGRGSLDSQVRRAVGAVTGAHGSRSARSSGAGDATHPATRPTGPSRKSACEPLCTTACAPAYCDQISPLCVSTASLTPTTPATATTATAPISVPSTDSAPSSACSFSPHTPPAVAPAVCPFPNHAAATWSCSHAPHPEPHPATPCDHACSALQHGQPSSAVHEGGATEAPIAAVPVGVQHHVHPPHLTILTPHSACSATTTPTPSHTTPAPPATTTPASMHQWRRRRRREWRGRDDSDSVRRMNASLAYLSVQHSHLVHLGAADDDDDGLDVDEMVVGARLDAAGEGALLMGAHMAAAVDGMAWHGHWGDVDEVERGEFGGECSEGWQEEEMGWVECSYSGPLTHAALAAAGVITSTAAASPSGAPSSFHSIPNRAAPPPSVSSHASTPAAMSPACLSPRAHPSAHSPCRSSPHGSPSATVPRVPCSLSHGPCDSSAGSGAGEGRRRSMLGMSRSMGVATLAHALSSLTHAAAVSSGSVSGSPAAARPASRLMLSSGPTPDAQHTYSNGSTSLGSGTGTGTGRGRGVGAEVEDVEGDMEGDMGLDIDILLSDLRSRQLRSASGPLAPRMSGPLRSVTHPAAGMAVAAAAAVASVGERGGEDRSAQLCDVGVDAWRGAAEADSGDHSLAACS
ncbi:unnamed protein product [Closterium sp. Naga37s-1]|nr:unnamed protein product [Closterium sp. Naga37s-1]